MRLLARGFSLIELLVSLVITTVLMGGIIKVFLVQNRTYTQQDLIASREQNVRLAMEAVTAGLRQARYGAPPQSSLLPTWIPWVGSFTINPKLTPGATVNNPDVISIAACFQEPIATISAGGAGAGTTTVNLTPTLSGGSLSSALDTNQKRLIRIGDSDLAHVKSVGSTSITIDTNPTTTSTNDGLSRAYPEGTPICRVDVETFTVDSSNRLVRNDNQGLGNQVVAEGIKNLKIALNPNTGLYQITLTAQTEWRDPVTGTQDIVFTRDNVAPDTK